MRFLSFFCEKKKNERKELGVGIGCLSPHNLLGLVFFVFLAFGFLLCLVGLGSLGWVSLGDGFEKESHPRVRWRITHEKQTKTTHNVTSPHEHSPSPVAPKQQQQTTASILTFQPPNGVCKQSKVGMVVAIPCVCVCVCAIVCRCSCSCSFIHSFIRSFNHPIPSTSNQPSFLPISAIAQLPLSLPSTTFSLTGVCVCVYENAGLKPNSSLEPASGAARMALVVPRPQQLARTTKHCIISTATTIP